jgi:hypothetical protein
MIYNFRLIDVDEGLNNSIILITYYVTFASKGRKKFQTDP